MKLKTAKRLRFEALEPRMLLALPDAVVKINEIMPHPALDTGTEWVELYNTTSAAIDLTGWYISDKAGNLQKFPIPAGTVIDAKGYLVFTDQQYGIAPYNVGFPEEMTTAYLTQYIGGVATTQDVKTYGPPDGETPAAGVLYGVDHDVSFGRYKKSDGDSEFVALSAQTRGGPNAYPAAGPIVISEVAYHPAAAGIGITDEYIELYNRSSSQVYFYDSTDDTPAPWKLFSGITDVTGEVTGVSFSFPTAPNAQATRLYLDPGEYALVVGIAPSTFRAKYGAAYGISNPNTVPIFGPWSTMDPDPGNALSNRGERITLMRPETGPHDSPGGATPYYFVDCVKYKDGKNSPWPRLPDTDGAHNSLTRVAPASWGEEVLSWGAATPTPGTANASVVGRVVSRNLFYKGSVYATAGDDAAIAKDKDALLPGKAATFDNYTSYDRGINGIMVDVAGLTKANPVPGDFQITCKAGNTSNWDAATPTVTIRAGEGFGGSCRVVLTWPDGTIKNKWLQVSISASDINMKTPDVFYFGNAIGDTGNLAVGATTATVDVQDEAAVRANKTGFKVASITNDRDFNRDGFVNATDELIARGNYTSAANPALLLFTPAAGAAAAALAAPAAAAASTATAAPIASSGTTTPRIATAPTDPAKDQKTRAAARGWQWPAWLPLLSATQRFAGPAWYARAADNVFASYETPATKERMAVNLFGADLRPV